MTWENPLTAHCSGFRTMQDNLSYTIPAQEIRGKIPQEIKGIFFRIGPALNELAGRP